MRTHLAAQLAQGRRGRRQPALMMALRPGRGAEGLVAHAVVAQLVQVELHQQFGGAGGEAPALRQQGAVLRRQQMAAEHQVLGGFGGAGAGVQIAAHPAAAGHAHQAAALLRLGHQLVARRGVEQQFRAAQAVPGAGRLGRPKVFAKLHGEAVVAQLKDLVGADAKGAQGRFHLHVQFPTGGEPTPLVELPVVGDGDLGHHAGDAPAADDRGAVEQAAVGADPRSADHGGDGAAAAGDHGQRLLRLVEETHVEEQVFRRVASDAKLREQRQGDALPVQPFEMRNHLPRVRQRVSDMHHRRHRRRPQEAKS